MDDDEVLAEGERRIWHLIDLVEDRGLLEYEIESLSETEARAFLMAAVAMLYVLNVPRRPIL